MPDDWSNTDDATSYRMRRVRSTDTSPELQVRRLLYGLGYRYRLHVKGLPGRPDLVLRRLHKVVFVHGCFWHRHTCKRGQSQPKARSELWRAKFDRNVRRDVATRRALRKRGWKALVIWECQLRDPEGVTRRLKRFLEDA